MFHDYFRRIVVVILLFEIKWSDKPDLNDARHLKKFMDEYPEVERAYIVCQTPCLYQLSDTIIVLPWQDIHTIFSARV